MKALSRTALCLLPLLTASSAAASQAPVGAGELGFWNGPEWVALEVDGSRLGVRFETWLTEGEVRDLIAAMPAVAPGQTFAVPYFTGHTVYLDTHPATTPNAALAAAEQIRTMAGVTSASPRLWAGDDPYYLTEEVLVRWLPGVEAAHAEGLLQGLSLTAMLDFAVNPGEVYRVPAGVDALSVAERLATSGLVEWAIPDFQLYRVTTSNTNDPLFGDQWHLFADGNQPNVLLDADIDADEAWNVTRGSSSTIVAVVDTGVELNHEDLRDNLLQGIDVLDNDNNPKAEDYLFGLFQESHSTSVCGVSAGKGNNGIGISGVSQESGIIPIRFLSEYILKAPTVQDEADAFNFACQNGAGVINNSWGPAFGGATLPASTKAAIDNCVAFGRGGLGTLIFFAAGNAGTNNSNNEYVTYGGTLGVTACTGLELLSSYSSWGNDNDVTAPSSGGGNGITTTDRNGNKGYAGGHYYHNFGGTSSASPAAAGVMLLILSANPALTWQQARLAMTTSTDKIDQAGGNYNAKGKSNLYGWGRVNAAKAVNVAQRMDAIQIQGPGSVQVGNSVTIQLTGGPPNANFQILYSESLRTEPGPDNHPFDIDDPMGLAGTGTTDASGNATWTSAPLPAGVAGKTFYVEAAASNGGEIFDSNYVTLQVQ